MTKKKKKSCLGELSNSYWYKHMSFYYKIHTFSWVDEVRRNVATVEPHALNDLKLIM